MGLFRHLTEEEENLFRKWARDNYKLYAPIEGIWHPVAQLECVLMNMESGYMPTRKVAEQIHALLKGERKDDGSGTTPATD
jgi:hypothetical protein